MQLTTPVASIVVAIVSAAISIVSLSFSFTLQARLQRQQGEETRAAEAQSLVAHYRDPLLRTAYDLQSRLYNMLQRNGFRGDGDSEYFRLNTLFVVADFFGWLEIIRRDMQFIDLGADNATRELNKQIGKIQHLLATTTEFSETFRLFRGQQRAIGELMAVPIEPKADRPGPSYRTMGYATFHTKMKDPEFSWWLDRFGATLTSLPDTGSERLRRVQNALIDLIDLLDPDLKWYSRDRERL